MSEVLSRLRKAGLRINAAKSLFAEAEIEYLGYVLAREGIKPQPEKISAILAINRIQGKYMLENKKLSDREILYQFLRRIPIQNRTIAYDIVNRDLNEKRV